jgi:hypothetical protein
LKQPWITPSASGIDAHAIVPAAMSPTAAKPSASRIFARLEASHVLPPLRY